MPTGVCVWGGGGREPPGGGVGLGEMGTYVISRHREAGGVPPINWSLRGVGEHVVSGREIGPDVIRGAAKGRVQRSRWRAP